MAQQRRNRNSLGFLIDSSGGGDRAEPGVQATAPMDRSTTTARVEEISVNPWQPRQEFDDERIQELADSIRQHGIVQPIVVRPKVGGGYQIVAGERRFRAARKAGLREVPIVLREVDDDQMLAVALVENVQRQDLGPIERARAFRRLAEERSMSHAQLAEISGLSRSTVSNSLRLLELESEIQEALRNEQITEGHARSLLGEKDPATRVQLFREMLEGDLSVRDVEEKVARARDGGAAKGSSKKSAEARQLERKLSQALGLKVVIRERGSKGRVEVAYSNLEEFDHIYKAITGRTPDL